MKTSLAPAIDAARHCFPILAAIFIILAVLSGNTILTTVGGAIIFTLYLAVSPDRFRSRDHSLKPAFALLIFVWCCAAIPVLLTWLEKH